MAMTQEQLLNSINSTAEMGAEDELFVLAYERKRLPDCLSVAKLSKVLPMTIVWLSVYNNFFIR